MKVFIVVIFISANKFVSFPRTSFEHNVVQIFAIFIILLYNFVCSPIADAKLIKNHQQRIKPCELGLRNSPLCQLFVGFLWIFLLRHFFVLSTFFITIFPFWSTCRLIALFILLSSNAFWIMSKGSALYLESFSHTFFVFKHPKCPLSLVGIKNNGERHK